MITVNEVMSEKVITLKASDSVATARELMKKEDIRHLPVVNDDHFPVGIITQRDILRAQDSELNGDTHIVNDKQVLLEQIMSREISYVLSDDPLRSAGFKLQKHKYGCLPVMNNNKLVGIITDFDFVDIAINLIEQMEQSEEY
ncbi:MAG: CBS domain-containing protein [gamma proteobacterium symbiont of Bathyaustriella thionipta]|nr:CBS domain-containing protein [gamma proteobacterium symbiont of Bathyaustriella thionipta]MCU7951749.1 CBS domain-containing protein [gamma proteobacterium symbiont of Bathyaustriella thionipta]MCU7958354.1 CBS domain-containing protein [gamma proteobacterium symbiont of Bathyaustriella thionipta]MCU7965630.1 CBS domain-containing protein [gamma proteobacterium symbiont of Bathyaustriella thionipta]